MVMPGECRGTTTTTCFCGKELKLMILTTCGPYLGFFCPKCGPFSRETEYFPKREDAEKALKDWHVGVHTGERY